MRLLRFICLVLTVAAVYFARYIFDHGTLTTFFPDWFRAQFSFANRLQRWQSEDLMILAWGISSLAAIVFGLIAPAWPSVQGLSYVKPVLQKSRSSTSWFAIVAMIFALLLTTFVLFDVNILGGPFERQVAWVLACVFVVFTGLLLNRPRSLQIRSVSSSNPEQSWPVLLLILIGAAVLFAFKLIELPPSIDAQSANYGLQAQALLHGSAASNLLAIGATGQPFLTTLVTALAMRLTGDALLGLRLAAVLSGLLMVVATWLVGCELFRRFVRRGRLEEIIEDDGRYPALIAAAVVAGSIVAIHYSRLPVLLEPIFWGTFGVWALLRGMRRADATGLALAGLMGGYAALLHISGMTLLVLMFCLIILSSLIPGMGFPRAIASARRWGWAIWLLAALAALSPALKIWMENPAGLKAAFPGAGSTWLTNIAANLLDLQVRSDSGTTFGYSGYFLHSALLPLLLLAVGCLLLNVDRLPGWVLTLWLVVAAAVGTAMSTQLSSWSVLLPILPAVGLSVAFAVDRVRSTLLDTLGGWINQSTIYLGVGVVLWATLANWIGYVHFIDTQRDSASEMALVIHNLRADQPVVIVDTADGRTPGWDAPVLKLVSNRRADADQYQSVPYTQLPTGLPTGTVLLIIPHGGEALVQAQARYPNGRLTIERDRRGNPVLYVLQIE